MVDRTTEEDQQGIKEGSAPPPLLDPAQFISGKRGICESSPHEGDEIGAEGIAEYVIPGILLRSLLSSSVHRVGLVVAEPESTCLACGLLLAALLFAFPVFELLLAG